MIRRLNHAVLWVADVGATARFYVDVLDFTIAARLGDRAVFLRAAGSRNDHDLGLFAGSAAANAAGAHRSGVGLYHLAWQVDTIDELAALRQRLLDAGAYVGESDHGVSRSVYGRDIDGNEFELLWASPRSTWPDAPVTVPLDLPAEVARWSGVSTIDQ